MPDEKDPKPEASLLDAAKARAAEAAATAAVEATAAAAREAASKAGHGLLDAIEKMVFGKVGGAEEQLRKEAEPDPIARFRAEAAKAEAAKADAAKAEAAKPAPAPAREDPEAVARKQLEALKAARANPAPADAPKKRTL